MSQYANFYLKANNGDFLPLGDYTRSSKVYQYIEEYAPYENGRPLEDSMVELIIDEIDESIKHTKGLIEKEKIHKADIISMSNPVEEKVEYLYSIDENINEYEEIVKELVCTKHFFEILLTFIEAAAWSSFDEIKYNKNDYVYVGIEWNPNYKEEE